MDVGHLLTSIPRQHRYQHVRPGDTVRVYYRVVEGERVRTQQLQGVVMWMTRSGPNANITIRRVIQGVGVERTFLLNSPRLERIDVVRQGKVRRARLYYQRGRTGRRARIKTGTRARRIIEDGAVVEADAPVAVAEDDVIEEEEIEDDVVEAEDVVAEAEEAEAVEATEETPEASETEAAAEAEEAPEASEDTEPEEPADAEAESDGDESADEESAEAEEEKS
ncbi:MAG: 50S ribosomal protein L19 [Dehalococcoidia bacterium]|nr:50S ribosomal protein L19 [Dehalococcoidia bacterium]